MARKPARPSAASRIKTLETDLQEASGHINLLRQTLQETRAALETEKRLHKAYFDAGATASNTATRRQLEQIVREVSQLAPRMEDYGLVLVNIITQLKPPLYGPMPIIGKP